MKTSLKIIHCFIIVLNLDQLENPDKSRNSKDKKHKFQKPSSKKASKKSDDANDYLDDDDDDDDDDYSDYDDNNNQEHLSKHGVNKNNYDKNSIHVPGEESDKEKNVSSLSEKNVAEEKDGSEDLKTADSKVKDDMDEYLSEGSVQKSANDMTKLNSEEPNAEVMPSTNNKDTVGNPSVNISNRKDNSELNSKDINDESIKNDQSDLSKTNGDITIISNTAKQPVPVLNQETSAGNGKSLSTDDSSGVGNHDSTANTKQSALTPGDTNTPSGKSNERTSHDENNIEKPNQSSKDAEESNPDEITDTSEDKISSSKSVMGNDPSIKSNSDRSDNIKEASKDSKTDNTENTDEGTQDSLPNDNLSDEDDDYGLDSSNNNTSSHDNMKDLNPSTEDVHFVETTMPNDKASSPGLNTNNQLPSKQQMKAVSRRKFHLFLRSSVLAAITPTSQRCGFDSCRNQHAYDFHTSLRHIYSS